MVIRSRRLATDRLGGAESLDFLAGGGAMGALMRAHDWSATPLLTPEVWPQSLRTSVSTCLNCSFPILIWWGRGLVMLYNDAYAQILGVKHPLALGARGRDVWPEIWDVIGPMLERVMTKGEASPADDLLLMLERHGYAEECYFSFSYSPIHDESGGVGGVFCPVIETTARVIGERRLRLQHCIAKETSDLRGLDAVFTTAAACFGAESASDFPVVGFYRLKEAGPATLIARAAGPHGENALPDALDVTAQQGVGAIFDLPTLGSADLPPGLGEIPVRQAVVLPLGAAGARVGLMVAGLNPSRPIEEMRDFASLVAGQISAAISHALAAEAERRRADDLAEVDRLKTAFFANVSHEFRTPLTLLLAPLEEAMARRPPDLFGSGDDDLDVAHRNALRLQKLVDTLLEFSRIEAGRAQANFTFVELGQLTTDLASGFRSACELAGLRLVVDCPALPRRVAVDGHMWEKIVLNLLSNAFKFTLEGEIRVTLRAEENRAVLEVSDTGVGIAASELPRLFERFHRITGQASRTHEGSGIGLALVQELVRLHDGNIEARSVEGVGTSLIVSLPLARERVPEATPATGATAWPDPRPRSAPYVEEALGWLPELKNEDPGSVPDEDDPELAKRARIVLVDDNRDVRTYTARLLSADWRVETFADGQSALKSVRADRPDLVVTDVMLPGLDGLGLLRALRSTPDLADVPVIMVSARAGEEARIEGLDAGADDYITKPFSAPDLRARVRSALSMAQMRRDLTEALEARQQQLLQLFEEAPGFMCVLRGPDHRYELVNASYNRLVGRSDLTGLTVREAFPEVDGQGFLELLDQVYASGEAFSARAMPLWLQPVEHEPPVEHFIDFIYQPITDAEGGVTGIFVEGSDVTAHVRSEAAMKLERARLQAIIDTVPAAVWFTHDGDANGVIGNRYANEVLRIPGEPGASLVSTLNDAPIGLRFLRDGVPVAEGTLPIERAARGETVPPEELEVVFDDGTCALLEIQATPILDDEGVVAGSVCAAIDITARRAAEQDLRDSEAEFRALVDNQASLCWMAEPDGGIYWYNRRWHDYTGKSLEELRGWGWQSVHDPEKLPEVQARWAESLKSGTIFEMTFPLRGADGIYRPFLTRVVPVRDSAGAIRRWFGNNIDISEQQATEAALRAREEELRGLNDRLEARVVQEVAARHEAQARLAQAQRMEALGQLAGGIAHDFNNVLQAVTGGLNLIEKRANDVDAVRSIARMAQDASERGAAITGRLLAFARRGELTSRAIDGQALLESLREILAPTLGPTIIIRTDIASEAPPMMADKAQLETVLVNLAINARDAMPDGGELTLGWRPEIVSGATPHAGGLPAGRYIRLDVTDTGAGMDAATLARASEPFFTTKPVGQGTGLGLAMARGLAEQSGGGFAIDSAPGQGARITLWFPQAIRAIEAEGAPNQPTPQISFPAKVLLVDDDPMVRGIMAQQLESMGFVISLASDGLDALDRLETGQTPHLLITDYAMPGMNGLTLIEEARRRQPELRALLLTGYADAEVGVKLEARGDRLTRLLRKPVSDVALLREAAALVESVSQDAASGSGPASSAPAA